MPTIRIANWNIQNYGVTKAGVNFGNHDVVEAIAKVIVDRDVDIFVMLEVNTTATARAQRLADIMAAELENQALNAGEYRRYVLSPNTGQEFYAFFIRSTGLTRPLPITGPVLPATGDPPTLLGDGGTAIANARFGAVAAGNLRDSWFPLLAPDLDEVDHHGTSLGVPDWPATRRPVLGVFWVPTASPANRLLVIVACHFAAKHWLAKRQFDVLPYFELLQGLANPPSIVPPVALTVKPGAAAAAPHQTNNYALLGDFNVDYLKHPGSYNEITGTPAPRLGARGECTDNTHLVTYAQYSYRDHKTTADLAINAYDNYYFRTAPGAANIAAPNYAFLDDVPDMVRKRELRLSSSIQHYAELDKRGFSDGAYQDIVNDFARQIAGDRSHMINVVGSLVGGRLISDHLPVFWDLDLN